jgi:hypothetical protein
MKFSDFPDLDRSEKDPKKVLKLHFPTKVHQRDFEREVARFLASKGMGLNKMKLIFDHRSKDYLRKLLKGWI